MALLAVRNERHYIGRCLRHLEEQGVAACVIDNESTDGTLDIVNTFSKSVVINVVHHPYPGYYDWEGLLKVKQRLASDIPAHWFMHLDADEIPEAPRHGQRLRDAILEVDRNGYNAINFDEFVFVPSTDEEHWEGRDYVAGMNHYYFFEPRPLRMIRAWKCSGSAVDIASSGGHDANFTNRKMCPDSFVMRHYISLSRNYLIGKYGARNFADQEIKKGWHYNRVGLELNHVHIPEPSRLNIYRDDGVWDKSKPWKEHYFAHDHLPQKAE